MPLYEFYCAHCHGVFESLRAMREAGEPAPCPVCDGESQRIMPSSFAAFTFRDGLPRRIPDRGTYWHVNQEVKSRNIGGGYMAEHQEPRTPDSTKAPDKGEQSDAREVNHLKAKHLKRLLESGIAPPMGNDGKPMLSPKMGGQ
jgi:putative FmdB family regulatory protein